MLGITNYGAGFPPGTVSLRTAACNFSTSSFLRSISSFAVLNRTEMLRMRTSRSPASWSLCKQYQCSQVQEETHPLRWSGLCNLRRLQDLQCTVISLPTADGIHSCCSLCSNVPYLVPKLHILLRQPDVFRFQCCVSLLQLHTSRTYYAIVGPRHESQLRCKRFPCPETSRLAQ